MEVLTTNIGALEAYQCGLSHQLSEIQKRMKVHQPKLAKVCFALYDSRDHLLRSYADSSSLSLRMAHYEAPLSSLPYLKSCLESRTEAYLSELSELHPSPHVRALLGEGFHSSVAMPIFAEQRFCGFLFLNSHYPDAFTQSDIKALKPYLKMLEVAIFSEYQLVHLLVEKLSKLIARSPVYQRESFSHKQRVAAYTNMIALALADHYDVDDEFVEHLTLFAQYHDIGKIRLSPELLCKQQVLTEDEVNQLRQHIIFGEEIVEQLIAELNAVDHPSAILLHDVISYHYEFLDGGGYPRQLQADEIPLGARIVCVANIFDAMTTHKPYKQGCSVPYALLELEKMVAMNKLDARCVDALRSHQHQLKSILERYPERDPMEGLY